MTKIFKQYLYELFVIACIFFSIIFVRNMQNLITFSIPNISPQESSLSFNKKMFFIFNLGQKRAISSFLWVKMLLESDMEHYQYNDLKSWMYLNLDLITDLDKNFKEAYYFGAQYLSVIKNDKLGAKMIFEKGLARFPDSFGLNFYGGIHDYLELKDYSGAVLKLTKIKDSPLAPPNINSIISKIKKKEDNDDTYNELLLEAYKKAPENSPLKNRYYEMMTKLNLQKN